MTYPMPDSDPGWVNLDPASIRLRWHPAGQLQLLVSVSDGGGQFNVSTFVLDGALRDVRHSATAMPGYSAPTTPRFITEGDRVAAEALTAKARYGNVYGSGPLAPPISGSNTDGGH